MKLPALCLIILVNLASALVSQDIYSGDNEDASGIDIKESPRSKRRMSNLEFLTKNDPLDTEIEHPQKGRSIVKDFSQNEDTKGTDKKTTTTKKPVAPSQKSQGVVWMSNAKNIAPHATPMKQKVVNRDELEISLDDKELMNGERCTEGNLGPQCIEETVCKGSLCTCKDVKMSGPQCNTASKSFFASTIQQSKSKTLKGKDFSSLKQTAEESLFKLEQKMSLKFQEHCALNNEVEQVVKYFGDLKDINQKEMEGIMQTVKKLNEKKQEVYCDFRQFLRCRKEKSGESTCDYWTPGVFKVVEGPGGDKTYKIGPNKECGNYPLIYESQVMLQCTRSTEGKCSREHPGICVCKKSRVCKEKPFLGLRQVSRGIHRLKPGKKHGKGRGHQKKKKKRRRKKKKHGGHSYRMNEMEDPSEEPPITEEEPPFTGSKYGEHCTDDDQCDVDRHMQCRADHFFTRASQIHQKVDEEDAQEENAKEEFDYEQEQKGEGVLPYSSNEMKKHNICNCRDGYSPSREGKSHIVCKIGGGGSCQDSMECAAEHCYRGTCLINTKYMIFVPVGFGSDSYGEQPTHYFNPKDNKEIEGEHHSNGNFLKPAAKSAYIFTVSSIILGKHFLQ